MYLFSLVCIYIYYIDFAFIGMSNVQSKTPPSQLVSLWQHTCWQFLLRWNAGHPVLAVVWSASSKDHGESAPSLATRAYTVKGCGRAVYVGKQNNGLIRSHRVSEYGLENHMQPRHGARSQRTMLCTMYKNKMTGVWISCLASGDLDPSFCMKHHQLIE